MNHAGEKMQGIFKNSPSDSFYLHVYKKRLEDCQNVLPRNQLGQNISWWLLALIIMYVKYNES